jgi:lysozyme
MTKARIASAVFAIAVGICTPFVIKHEGESLVAYKDPVGILTICHGETLGVIPGMKMTKQECAENTRRRIAEFMRHVDLLIVPEVPPEVLAAHTSFAYNIGVNGYERSQTRNLTNRGQFVAGCKAMLNWYMAGGRDCRIRKNNCYGVYARRQDEVKLCLSGL